MIDRLKIFFIDLTFFLMVIAVSLFPLYKVIWGLKPYFFCGKSGFFHISFNLGALTLNTQKNCSLNSNMSISSIYIVICGDLGIDS